MQDNNEKLKKWVNEILVFEKLNLSQAKEVYNKLINENNCLKRKLLRDKLIYGTLYVVYDFIKVSKFNSLKSNLFDIDDIISLCCESWIKVIDSGKLLYVSSFSMLFYMLYGELNAEFAKDKFFLKNNTSLSYDLFFDLFLDFYSQIEYIPEFSYNNFVKYMDNKKKLNNKYLNVTTDKMIILYGLINGIYDSFSWDIQTNMLAKTRLIDMRNFLLSIGLENLKDSLTIIKSDYCYIEEIENRMIYEQFFNEVFLSGLLTEKQIDILSRRYGFFNKKQEIFPDIALDYNLVSESIRQYEIRAIKKIKKNINYLKYKEVL